MVMTGGWFMVVLPRLESPEKDAKKDATRMVYRDDIYHIFRFLKVFSIHFWVAIYINLGGVVEFKL